MKHLVWNRHTKLILKHAAGWLCILLGFIMLVTPGQGLLTLLLGVYLLADEIPFFGKIRSRIQRKFPKASQYMHEKGERLRAKFHRDHSQDDEP